MHIAMLGLPGSGKTTFLAAMWHVVNVGDVADALVLQTLGADSEYLNRLTRDWRSGKRLEHTGAGEVYVNSMTFMTTDDDPSEVIIPDLSGEQSGRAFLDRAWPSELESILLQAEGILLFVHVEQMIPPALISEALAAMEDNEIQAPPPASVSAAELWEAETVPTVVKLVDLLQFVSWSRPSGQALRVAIVASAWDLSTFQEKVLIKS